MLSPVRDVKVRKDLNLYLTRKGAIKINNFLINNIFQGCLRKAAAKTKNEYIKKDTKQNRHDYNTKITA